VDYINVGQGDSILIQVSDCDILIDAGTASYGSTVSSYLKSQQVDDLELVINTHPDADHCGGLTQVFKDFAVEQVWISKDTSKTSAAYKNFTSAITSEGLTAKKPNAGTVYTYGYLTLTVVYSELVSGDSNNSSIVTMLEYGSFKFLFTGDVGQVAEPSIISSGYDISCDVLKVGHHGSKYSSTTAFLNKVKAEYGVICVGSNSYGHPTSEALGRLSAAGVTVYRTDKNGNVRFSTDGNTLYLPNGSTDTTGSGSGLPSGGSTSGGSTSSGSTSSGSTSGGTTSGGSTSGGSTSGGSTSSGTTTSNTFIGNTETKVFHLPTCGNLPAASKQNVMYNYWWIINIAGYTPCGRCLKNYSTGATYVANATSKVYHLSTCAYLPSSSNRVYITSTAGYTPCGHCIL
jgi:beta-lactamase superfamily II metal-dependent hydrolase